MSAKAAAPAGKKKLLVILVVVAVCSIGAGVAVPHFMRGATPPVDTPHKAEKPAKDAYIEFGDVTVNLAEGRLSRYLRVKIVLVTDHKHEKDVTERIEARKAALRNWLIAHLSDKTLPDVTGRVSINRIRREILEQFSAALFPEGGQQIRDVLFAEFVVQ
jgi:flagellar basal body-associated protein FliL